MVGITTIIWSIGGGAAGLAAAVGLFLLHRQRRLLLLDRQRRRFLVSYVQGTLIKTPAAAPRPRPAKVNLATPVASVHNATPVGAANSPASSPAAPPPVNRASTEGIVYIDAQGRCTFANQAARSLLGWQTGELTLSDVLAGGKQESAALIASLGQQGLIEQHATALAGPSLAPLEISAVALRDRDDNLWGAALFIHQPPVVPALPTPPAAPSPH